MLQHLNRTFDLNVNSDYSTFNIQNILNSIPQVSTYSQGEVFGEDEILLDKPRQYSVICDTTDGGELIAITKNVRVVGKKNIALPILYSRNLILIMNNQ